MDLKKLVLLGLLGTVLVACGGGGDTGADMPDPSAVPTIQPGETLRLESTETIAVEGIYFLPDNAMFLRTRCFGEVAVTFETSTGSQMTNTCNGLGNSSQLNVVTGVQFVLYEFGNSAYARVTVD